jgi:nucleoside-diphosphate-sugar epimerase
MRNGDGRQRSTVLLTGASGNIGRGFCEEYLRRYRDAYELRIGVRRPEARDRRFADNVLMDVEDPASLEAAFRGVDAVIHLAANPEWEAPWEELLGPNVTGTYNVFEAARGAGCPRVVYASSVHAIMGYPVDYQAHHDDASRPDTLYGATKVLGEAMCSSYAHLHGMSCIAVRIGAYVADDEDERVRCSANPQLLDIVVSQRDMAQLLHRCVTAPEDVRYAIVNGLSNNRYKRMDIEHARRLLGYAPEDDAFKWSELVRLGEERRE